MRLKRIAFVSIVIVALIIIGAEIIVSNVIVRTGFEELEQQRVAADIRRVNNELQKEIEDLDTFLWDWTSWDDTYEFAQVRNPHYINSNLPISTFLEQNLNIVLIQDSEDRVIYIRAVNEDGEDVEPLAHELLAMIRGSKLPKIVQDGGEGGVLLLSEGPLLFAKRPILYSSGDGPPAGSMIMARFLMDYDIKEISERLEIPFVASVVKRDLKEESTLPQLKQLIADKDNIIAVKDRDNIQGFSLLRDIYNNPALVLTLTEPRNISEHGNHVALINTLFTGLILILFSSLIYLLLQKKVILRVVGLNHEVQQIKMGRKSSMHVTTTGDDEISELAESVNDMLRQIAEDQHNLRVAHDMLEQKVAERTSELERANEELLCLDKAKSHFLASTSHELRTPLTAILGFLKLMERSFQKNFRPHLRGVSEVDKHMGTFLENFKIVRHETDRLGRLINDLLDLNKIEANRIEWRDKDLNVSEIVNSAVNAISGQFKGNDGLELKVDLPPSLPSLHADPDRIHQVLINLLNNAAKFTARGSVIVAVRDSGENALEFSVTDTGRGIPEEDLTRVFDMFYQSQADTPLGTGLGLAISREIVEHYGGRIWVESVQGEGSSFRFLIPVNTEYIEG